MQLHIQGAQTIGFKHSEKGATARAEVGGYWQTTKIWQRGSSQGGSSSEPFKMIRGAQVEDFEYQK